MREVQSDSGFQVRQLFTESVREACEPAKLHPHRQVLPFDERSADMVRVGVALSD